MKTVNKLIVSVIILVILASCKSFDEINTDPDSPTKASSSLLATGLIMDIVKKGGDKYFIYDNLLTKHLAWGEGMEYYQYNLITRSDFGGYTSLINCIKMVEVAPEQYREAYEGLAAFIKAYKLFYMSMEMGDVPYEDALLGETGTVKPRYNTQKEVMLSVLSDLDKSYALFAKSSKFDGDPIFNGDTNKWKKIVATFQLRVLISLSKKEGDADLNIKERFTKILDNCSLPESNSDNLQLTYSDKAKQVYPFYSTQTKHAGYSIITTMVIDELKNAEDYRLFYYARPAKSKTTSLISDNWDDYIGVNPSIPFEDVKTAYSTNNYCGLNGRYVDYPAGEPLIRIGYAEYNFILAEASLRKWISGDAANYYKKGIKAAMDFVVKNTPNEIKYHSGRELTEVTIDKVLEHPYIQLNGSFEENLNKILTQKYLAAFMQNTYDLYYDHRRTGYPKFPINPQTNLNEVKDKMPSRWMYPTSEYDYNKENVEAAVQRQWKGVEDVNKVMWILQ